MEQRSSRSPTMSIRSPEDGGRVEWDARAILDCYTQLNLKRTSPENAREFEQTYGDCAQSPVLISLNFIRTAFLASVLGRGAFI